MVYTYNTLATARRFLQLSNDPICLFVNPLFVNQTTLVHIEVHVAKRPISLDYIGPLQVLSILVSTSKRNKLMQMP
jgi:hypothetical protein